MSLNDNAEMEAELIKRNREIAKVRDEVSKVERRLEESQMRNDELLEKVSDLDTEVTKRNLTIESLNVKVAELEESLFTANDQAQAVEDRHRQHLESLRDNHEAEEQAQQKMDEEKEALNKKISDLEEQKTEIERKFSFLEADLAATKAALQQSEASSKDYASRSLEQGRKIKELEEELLEKEGAVSAVQAQTLEEERLKASSELNRVTSLMEEHKCAATDLEQQTSDQDKQLKTLRQELEDAQRDMGHHGSALAELEKARDEAVSEYREHKATADDILQAERKRQEEALNKANQKAAGLDGRLDGQRALLMEANQALYKSERQEEQVSEEMSARIRELRSEHEEAMDALARERASGASALASNAELSKRELETEMVVMQRNAQAEVDAAVDAASEASEARRRLETRLEALEEDHSESQAQQARMQESMRSQGAGLRERLAEAEERSSSLQQDLDRLKKDLGEAKQEAERKSMAHRQEVEKMQQALEAEQESLAQAEKISLSNLEEKDTLLEHTTSAKERLEKELQETKQSIAEMEQAAEKAKRDADSRVHGVGLRVAELESELQKRQNQVTEAEGRLDSQRQYLEQLSSTLEKAQGDRESLMEAKSSLEKELQLEQHREAAVSASLQDIQNESANRCRELEVKLALDRDSHEAELEDLKKSMSTEIRQTSERLATAETELESARERVGMLMRNKADLQAEVGQQREKFFALEAGVKEHRAASEQLGLELEQARESKAAMEESLEEQREETRKKEGAISDLKSQVAALEAMRNTMTGDFSEKVQRLDDVLAKEKERSKAAEKALAVCQQEAEGALRAREQELARSNQDLKASVDSWREKAEEYQVLLAQKEEQVKSIRTRVDDLDGQRRDMESNLRGEVAAAEAKIRRLEVDVQKAQAAAHESKADAAHERSTMMARVSGLERQLEQEERASRDIKSAKEAAESLAGKKGDAEKQLNERLGMAAEELFSRQVDAALEVQRLRGSLEESRRSLRNSMASPVAVADGIRVQGLEQQLAEERRKSIEQAVAVQRAERRCKQLEETQTQSEAQRSDAVQRAREAERKVAVLEEDLRKSQLRQSALDTKCSEVRETAAMAAAEMSTVQYESKYESSKLRGALDELRYMLKLGSK